MAHRNETTTVPSSEGPGAEPGAPARLVARRRTHVGRLVLVALLAAGIFVVVFAVDLQQSLDDTLEDRATPSGFVDDSGLLEDRPALEGLFDAFSEPIDERFERWFGDEVDAAVGAIRDDAEGAARRSALRSLVIVTLAFAVGGLVYNWRVGRRKEQADGADPA